MVVTSSQREHSKQVTIQEFVLHQTNFTTNVNYFPGSFTGFTYYCIQFLTD